MRLKSNSVEETTQIPADKELEEKELKDKLIAIQDEANTPKNRAHEEPKIVAFKQNGIRTSRAKVEGSGKIRLRN